MKIAVWHNLHSGGGKRALWHHVAGLLQRGHQVESWCPLTASQEFLPLSGLCPEHVLPFRREGRWKGWMDVPRMLREMQAHCRECGRQMEEKGFDILFANACVFFATTPVARFVRIPKVLYLGEPHREFYEALPKLLWLTTTEEGKGLRRIRLARGLANFIRLYAMRVQAQAEIANAAAFDEILVNSLFSRESVLRAYGLESRVCYLGVDTERFQPSGDPPGDYVIGLGSLDYWKGLDRAVRAIGAIPMVKRPRLVWVGNRCGLRYVVGVNKLARDLGVEFQIRHMIGDPELVGLISRARVMLYTSRLEPFGLAPLEANACGVPVVAVAEGGVRETIENGRNGLLVSDAQPANLAAALMTILDNPSLAAEMRAKARDHVVSRWSLEPAILRLEEILLRTIKSHRMPAH
jgi:glycosyltransferase involved in cell wall biosynthesis